jgi:hypothetical protein
MLDRPNLLFRIVILQGGLQGHTIQIMDQQQLKSFLNK